MQKTGINCEITQEMFDSARNAAQVGQSQYFTPVPFGRLAAVALPRYRPAIIDLNCGAGHLLHAATNETTENLYGIDIDPCRSARRPLDEEDASTIAPDLYTALSRAGKHRITCDLTVLYPLLKEVDFKGDLFVLNPPYSLEWSREKLALLAESEVPAVRFAFTHGVPASAGSVIDSSIATIMIALDLCSRAGEGMAIVNNRTIERLVFAENASFSALAEHIWARAIIEGNPMTGRTDANFSHDEKYETAVVYFAVGHTAGPSSDSSLCTPNSSLLRVPARWNRLGPQMIYGGATPDIRTKWIAVADELRTRASYGVPALAGSASAPRYHLWLDGDGLIKTGLSSFEECSVKLNKTEVKRLHELNGKQPMQTVLQRAGRDELLHVIDNGGWTVHPDLRDAIKKAVLSYHAARAPLIPLSEIQRLGYLEEQDNIQCKRDLGPFRAGQNYPLRTQTASVTRTQRKPNALTGELEQLEFKGEELATFIAWPAVSSSEGREVNDREYAFMDSKHMNDPLTTVQDNRKAPKKTGRARPPHGVPASAGPAPIDFSLQQLCEHFVIPEVPDVATVHPDRYRAHLATLSLIEETINELLCQPT